MSAQTLTTLKEAQTAFKNLHTSSKTAFNDPSMGMADKDQMIEQIFQQAETLVDTAITAVETVEGGNGSMINNENEMGGAPPAAAPPTDVGPLNNNNQDPDKLNTAQGEEPKEEERMKKAMQKMAQDIEDQGKELDEMKNKEAQMKLAQKYSELYPMAMRTAKFEEFMSHKSPTAVLEARLDEASVIMSRPNALKIAQQEGSPFAFDDLESTSSTKNIDTGGKI